MENYRKKMPISVLLGVDSKKELEKYLKRLKTAMCKEIARAHDYRFNAFCASSNAVRKSGFFNAERSNTLFGPSVWSKRSTANRTEGPSESRSPPRIASRTAQMSTNFAPGRCSTAVATRFPQIARRSSGT